MGLIVRPAEVGDRELLRHLLFEYLFEFDGRTEPYPYLDAYWEEEGRRPFVLEQHGEAAGLCLVRARDDGWSIAEFYVVPSLRRAGIGRAAVELVAQYAREAGATWLEAKVHPDNRDALPFWLAAGFDVVDSPGVLVTRRPL